MDGVVARLQDDPAVRAFVVEALLLTDGDPERAADLMRRRLARARRQDARVLRLVLAEALALAAAEQPGRPTPLRERLATACARSLAVASRGAELRRRAAETVAACSGRPAARA
jgi:hypothetical protein